MNADDNPGRRESSESRRGPDPTASTSHALGLGGILDAVTASCAVPGVWPPATIDGRRYIDGGVRSGANADCAGGASRILVILPLEWSPAPA